MRSRLYLTAVLVLAVACACLAQPAGQPEQIITQLKKQCRQTALVSGGTADAIIVVPDGDNYRAMALQVKRAISDATGATLEVKLHSQVSADKVEQHVILLGNMDNNSLAERLYWQRYIACDLDYPGPEGYVVRTACDPWGKEKNVIMLGGSDAGGVQQAVDAFVPLIKPGKDLVLPLLTDIYVRGKETITEEALQKEWEDYRKRYLEAESLPYGCEGRIYRLAYDYYLTGVEEYAKIYNEVIKRWMEEYYKYTRGRQLSTPKYAMPDMYLSWDLVEESPSISDEVRLEMTNLLYDYAILMGESGRVRNWEPGTMRTTGHVVIVSVAYGHAYFTKYYPDVPMERLQKGMEDLRVAMDSYFQTDGFVTETGYLGYHPKLLAYYTQYADDYRWYENKKALRWQEYHTMVTDNNGTAMGGWSPSHLLAARYYNDGRWLWLSSFQRRSSDYSAKVTGGKLRRNCWLGRPDIEPAPPMDITGMRAFRMSENWYKELARVRGELDVPQEKAFNQVAMRTDFNTSNQYARIAGVNIGFHYGAAANAFSVLHDKGRNWAVNGRWGMSLMKYYNTMLVIHNGQASPKIPYMCNLETACDLPQTGFVQSQMPKYNATDWMRSVVWNKQRYWLVFDDVRAQEAGDYTCLCQWRVGPQPQIEAGRAVVGDKEPALVIETAGSPTLAVSGEKSAHGTVGSHMYRQGRSGTMEPGETASFCNLLWVKGGTARLEGWRRWQATAETANFESKNPQAGSVSLRLVNTGVGWQCVTQALPRLEPGAKYRVSGWVRTNGQVGGVIELRDPVAEKVAVANVTTKEEQWTKLEFEFEGVPKGHTAQLWLMHTTYKAEGGIAWFDSLEVVKVVEPDKNLLLNGGFEEAGDVKRMEAQYSLRGLADGCAIVSDGEDYWIAGASSDGQPREFKPVDRGISVTAKAFNMSPSYFALTGATALEWDSYGLEFASDKPVDIEFERYSGVGIVEAKEPCTISIGRSEMQLTAGRHEINLGRQMGVGGTIMGWADLFVWRSAQPPGGGEAEELAGEELQPAWEWQDAEIQAETKAVKVADLDGDGKPETVAGLTDGTTVVLSADGKEICRHKAEKAINDVAVVDLNGDGKLEILSACDDYNLYATDLQGQEVWVFNNEGLEITNKLAGQLGIGRYVSSEGEFISLKIVDLDGDGTPEILAGAKCFMHGSRHVYGTLWVLSLEGKQLWHVFNFGGTVDTIACADLDADGKLEIAMGTGGGTYGCHVYIVDSQGQKIAVYGAGYGEKRASFARLRAEGPLAMVRLEHTNGTVWVNDAAAEPTAWWTYNSSGLTSYGPVITDFDGDGLNEILIGGASGDVYLLSDGAEAQLVWRTNVGAAVTALQAAKIDGQDRILVGTRTGTLFVLDSDGEVLAHADAGMAIVSLDVAAEARTVALGLFDGRTVGVGF